MEAILYFIFAHISLCIPGYTFIALLGVFQNKPGIRLSLGYLVSIVFTALLALFYYVFHVPATVVQIVFWVTFISSAIIFFQQKIYRSLAELWFVLTSVILMSAFSLCIISFPLAPNQDIVPDPEPLPNRNYSTLNTKIINLAQTRANDNYIPYRQAQFFVNRSNPGKDSFINEWGVHFFQRTPLMGAVTAGYFLAFKDRPPVDYTWSVTSVDPDNTYMKFQVLAQVLNSLLIIPGYFLIRKLFNRKVAVVSIVFLIPSQFFAYNSFFTWPKSFVAFFILTSWLLLLTSRRKSYTVAAAIASGLAYLTHDLAVLYIGTTIIFLLFSRRFKDSVIVAIGSAAFAIPWLFTAGFIYHKPSSFILYPLSTKDIPQASQSKDIIRTFFATSPLKLIWIRVESLFYLLTPYQLIITEGNQNILIRLWALGLYSVPGAVGVGLFVPMLGGIWKYRSQLRLWILWLMPIVMSVLIIGWPRGLGALHFAEACVVILTAVAIGWLIQLQRPHWLYLAYLLNIIQTVYFIVYTYNFSLQIRSMKDVLSILTICGIVIICFASLHLVISNHRYGRLLVSSDK